KPIHIYLAVSKPDELLECAREQEWSVADDGRLVLLKPYYRDPVWHGRRTAGGLPVVSDLQLVLDLWSYSLRAWSRPSTSLARIIFSADGPIYVRPPA